MIKKKIFLATVLLGITSPAYAQTVSSASGAQSTSPAVSVIKVDEREIVSKVIVSGTLLPREDVMIMPEVEGLVITDILVDEGANIVKGTVLARLNRRALDISILQNKAQIARIDAVIAQSKAQIIEADANRTQASNSFTRAGALLKTGSASADIYDQKQAASKGADARLSSSKQALEIALADKAAAQATLNETELQVSRTEIKAPVDGVVYRRNAQLGSVASAAGEPLFRVISGGLIELEAEVSELDIASVKQGQGVSVNVAGIVKPINGIIRLVSPEIDKVTRLGKVRIALDNNPELSTGAFARGIIETARKRAITVPLLSITYTKSGPVLQSVVQSKIVSKPVQIGLIGDGRAEIMAGINAGDSIVVRSGSFLRDGDLIRPVTVPLAEGLPK